MNFFKFHPLLFLFILSIALEFVIKADWKKHEVFTGAPTFTAIAGEFTGDKLPDIIANSGGKTRLFVAPDWKEIVLDDHPEHRFIHSEAFDVDQDGDLDYLGARYQPGLIIWLEQPNRPTTQPWPLRIVSRKLNGIHGLLQGDVDQNGKTDLIANSAQPVNTPHPESLAWIAVPRNPRMAKEWKVNIIAPGDAPGLTHYLGFGDVNGDGRPDVSTGAKGKPSPHGNYFAWWEAPEDLSNDWKRHMIANHQLGATNIHPRDINGDGRTDFIASRGHGNGIVWFEAPDWKVHEIHPTLREPHSLIALDLDRDGDIDAASCAFGDKEAWWFENDGKGGFTNHRVAINQEAYDIRALDMDQDGDLDLIIAGRRSNNVAWYENPEKIRFRQTPLFPATPSMVFPPR